jgi:hypothetical protein
VWWLPEGTAEPIMTIQHSVGSLKASCFLAHLVYKRPRRERLGALLAASAVSVFATMTIGSA